MSVISSLLFSFPVFYFIIFYFARINPYICGMIILLSIPKHLMKQKFPKRHSGICALMAGTALLAACHSSSESRHETGRVDAASTTHRPTGTINVTATSQAGVSSPVVYIYKMKKDYSKLVPVLMNEERTRIVSYPDPVDLQRAASLPCRLRSKGAIGWTTGGLAPPWLSSLIPTRNISGWPHLPVARR